MNVATGVAVGANVGCNVLVGEGDVGSGVCVGITVESRYVGEGVEVSSMRIGCVTSCTGVRCTLEGVGVAVTGVRDDMK